MDERDNVVYTRNGVGHSLREEIRTEAMTQMNLEDMLSPPQRTVLYDSVDMRSIK